LPIAKSCILENRNATIYHSPIRQNELTGFGAKLINQPIVIDDKIITSWNPSTAVNVAFILLEKLTTKQNSDKVRLLMGF